MKKLLFLIIIVLIGGYVYFHGCAGVGGHTTSEDGEKQTRLLTPADVGLYDVDGGGTNYAFTYNGEEFRCMYMYDCWTIYDSYKITDKHDMETICQALIDVHPVHGADLESYRTPEDMAYEWQQHNIAYKYLPEDNAWRTHAANVDLDPYDQGRSFEEIYEDRTGQELDVKEKVKEKVEESIEDGTIFQKIEEYIFN